MPRRSLLVLIAVAACSPAPPPIEPRPPMDLDGAVATPPLPSATASASTPEDGAQNLLLAELSSRFVRGYLQRAPVDATQLGLHDYDAKWPDVSADGDAEFLAFLASTRKELATIARDRLTEQNQIDASILANQLDLFELYVAEIKPAENNPRFYTALVGDAIDPLVTRDFAPLADRMKSLRARLASLPPIVAVAKKRLTTPARIHTETAIKQTKGLIALVEKQLPAQFASVPEQKADLEAAAKTAAAALHDYQTFLEKDLLARSTGSFRAGRAKLEKLLRYGLDDDVAIDDIATAARALLAKTQDEMADTAKELWPTLVKTPLPAAGTPAEKKAIIRKVLDKLAEDRSDNKTIIGDATKLLTDATAFVQKENIVRVPDEPCRVIEMPEYKRGVSIAYCDSTGPLEKKQESVYAIAPTPSDWPAKRAVSFYREYNRAMLADLTVHEAMPGHYLQAMHANRTKSELRGLFASGPFVEGWAVYAESVMAKHGFGGAKVRFEHQKMVLRLCANAILDHDIHAGAMEEKEALALMMDDAFQEEGEAVAKWARARLTAGQLTTYYYGFTEMKKLRAAAETAPGFTERAYHDKLLAYGSPAMRYVRRLMLAR
jgi:uncharacterized protein (DUF885 family)